MSKTPGWPGFAGNSDLEHLGNRLSDKCSGGKISAAHYGGPGETGFRQKRRKERLKSDTL